jgi:dolichyl-phosphate-mannose-protein mannosyltransferase
VAKTHRSRRTTAVRPRPGIAWFERYALPVVVIGFVAYFVVGFRIVGDYGISWDEPAMLSFGKYAVSYILAFDRHVEFLPPETLARFHPVTFEVLYRLVNTALGVEGGAGEYLVRHTVTFVAAFGAAVAFYRLARKYLGASLLAATATLCLVCQPRIFADSFYNPKDVPFLVTYVIGTLTMVKLLERGSGAWALLHSLACAVSIGTRIGGVFLVAVTLLAGAGQVLLSNHDSRLRVAWPFALFALAVGPLTVLCWPALWQSPVAAFLAAVVFLRQFPFPFPVLFNGELMPPGSLPWYYAPEWIAFTTPLAVLAIIVCGSAVLVWRLAAQRLERETFVLDSAMLLLAGLPLAAVIVGRTTIYDGWRHLFFVFPILVLVGFKGVTEGIEAIAPEQRRRYAFAAVGAILALNMGTTIRFMVAAHPYQNVYFNVLAGRNLTEVRRNLELDYWGLSYRQALEYVLRNDSADVLKIAVANAPGIYNSYILPSSDRTRLRLTDDPSFADYFISNYRWHPADYDYGEPFHSIDVDGGSIITIRRLK